MPVATPISMGQEHTDDLFFSIQKAQWILLQQFSIMRVRLETFLNKMATDEQPFMAE